jgi:transposase
LTTSCRPTQHRQGLPFSQYAGLLHYLTGARISCSLTGRTPSGTSVNQKPHLSKAGNRYLRLALFMPALSAVRHEKHVNGYYRHLIEDRGLKKIQAICAVMRKLLHAIHGMLKARQPFDGSRFYALVEAPA